MEPCDLPHQRKAESRSAKLAAEGLVHAEKGLEDTLPELPWDAAASIRYMDDHLSVPLLNIHLHHTIGTVVFDGILHQIEKHTAKQHIAADNGNILPLTREGNSVALGQRGEVGKDLIDHG